MLERLEKIVVVVATNLAVDSEAFEVD